MTGRLRRCALLVLGLGLVVLGVPAPPASAADPVILSGNVSLASGEFDSVYVVVLSYPDANEEITATSAEPDGSFTVPVEPGDYWVEVRAHVDSARYTWMRHLELSTNRTLDLTGDRVPVGLDLVSESGLARAGRAELECGTLSGEDWFLLEDRVSGVGHFDLTGAEVPDGCDLNVWPANGDEQHVEVPVDSDGDNQVTVRLPDADVVVSGAVSTHLGDISEASVSASNPDFSDDGVAAEVVAADGTYELTLPEPGDYRFDVWGMADNSAYLEASFHNQIETRIDEDMVVDLTLPETPVTVTVEGPDGQPRSAYVELWCAEERYDGEGGFDNHRNLLASAQGVGPFTFWGFPVEGYGGCSVDVSPDEGRHQRIEFTVDPDGDNEITVVIVDTFTVSGRVFGPDASPMDGASVNAVPIGGAGGSFVYGTTDEDGRYSLALEAGIYQLEFSKYSAGRFISVRTGGVEVDSDQTVDADFPEPDPVAVVVHLVGENGTPAEGSAVLRCRLYTSEDPNPWATFQTDGAADAAGRIELEGIPSHPEWSCNVQHYLSSGTGSNSVYLTEGDEYTVFGPTGAFLEGAPGDSADADGVSDVLEAQGPNGGDGNSDGDFDFDQAHVASLPTNGSGDPDDPYLTIAGPPGTTLADVSTVDDGSVAVPPPAGVSLPAGLAAFTVTGIAPGATAVVSVYPPSMQDVNGYAKYDPDTQTWSVLPAGRVQVHPDHLDVTLTDGGVGDADGIADGRIVDPGGVAIVPAGDTTPPVVTGVATRAPNANGWYNANVRIRWTAVDPGSGVANPPADTILTGEGGNLTAQSPQVCDRATPANCTRGTVTGLRIDRTAPVVTVGGVTNGSTYVLGAVPTPTCSATDALSGPAGPCTSSLTGGNTNRVGSFIYTATGTDLAGNRRTVTVGYRVVYRFDGFLQPLNDPSASPGAPMSVFRRPSTVAVGFVLRTADGTVVTPVTRPVWLSPSRGARTNAAVNETSSNARPSSGTAFTWRGDRWQYDWATRNASAGYVYRLGVRLDDGTTRYVSVGVR